MAREERKPPLLERMRARRRERAEAREEQKEPETTASSAPGPLPLESPTIQAPPEQATSQKPAAGLAPEPVAKPPPEPLRAPVPSPVETPVPLPAPPQPPPAPPPRTEFLEPTERAPADVAARESAAIAPPAWRAIPEPAVTEVERGGSGRRAAVYILHLLAAFIIGAVVLFVVAAIATLVSDGSLGVLDTRGLPIFIAGATSIVAFAMMRTGRRAVASQAGRAGMVVSVLVGFVVLVVASALLYRPSASAEMQERLDRVVRTSTSDDAEQIQSFELDADDWNSEISRYQQLVQGVVRAESADLPTFRSRVLSSESALEGIIDRMRTHAEAVKDPDLRDGLNDLTSVFESQLAGLRLVSRGLLIDELGLVRTGDTRFKDARRRATVLFEERLRALIEDAGGDADSFAQSLSG